MVPDIHITSIKLAGGQDIAVHPAAVTVVVGGNNTGKTTLLRQISEWLYNNQESPTPTGQYRILTSLAVEKGQDSEKLIQWIHENCALHIANPSNPGATGYVRAGASPLHPDSVSQLWLTCRGGHLGQLASFLVNYTEAGSFGQGFNAGRRNRPDDPPSHYLHYLESNAELRSKLDELCYDIFGQHLTLDKLGQTLTLRMGKPASEVPPPGYDDDELPFRRELDKLEPLDNQGHGMRSLLGKLLPIAAAAYPIIIIDEPEAFLHPPQASKFGRVLGDITRASGVQVILATHDRNILIGLLESRSKISVVRLTREANVTCAYQLSPEKITEIWSEPALRYSHVLDGLFHQRVVIVENERDCTFYSAALDAAHEASPLPINPSDVLFVPTNGKDGIAPVAEALGAIKVPVVVSPDIDILDDPNKIERLVDSLGHDWTNFLELYNKCTSYLREPREPVKVSQIVDDINRYAEEVLAANPNRKWDPEVKEKFGALTRSGQSRWGELKKYGTQAFKSDIKAAASTLLDQLDAIGLVVVRAGELESFANDTPIAARKGLGWLRAALDAGVHQTEKSIEHVRKLVSVKPNVID